MKAYSGNSKTIYWSQYLLYPTLQ